MVSRECHLRSSRDAFFPAGNDVFSVERKAEGLVAIDARVELLAIGKPARVMHDDVLAGTRGQGRCRR
jgi:hypothetical protein